jgi:hypothetical protein
MTTDSMTIRDAQREVRSVFLGAFSGLIVAGALWLLSAALGTWDSPRRGILILVVGGVFIYPLSQGLLRLMGRRSSLSENNPMRGLAMETAFIIPLCLPVVAAATLYRLNWFYPAMMVVVGAHYLPFVFLYGMWQFIFLGGLLVASGVAIGLFLPGMFSFGGWFTGILFLLSAFLHRSAALRQNRDIPLARKQTP